MITVAEARARGISLPSDDDAAQGVIDEQEAWLAARIGPLDGSRTETFYVGLGRTDGKLRLRRRTDSVAVTDGGAAVSSSLLRLVDNGGAIRRKHPNGRLVWTGPYVEVTYTPNDEDQVRRVLFALIALEAQPVGPYSSERMGEYSYTRGQGSMDPTAARAALVSSLLPKPDKAMTLHTLPVAP